MSDSVDSNPASQDALRYLAHELRQPLSAMESIAFSLQMTAEGRGELAAHVDRLQQMVENANWVLSEAIYHLHLPQPVMETADAAALVEETLAECWAREGLAVEYAASPELPAVQIDPEQARHVFRGILHYLRRQGTKAAEVSAFLFDDRVQVEFRAAIRGGAGAALQERQFGTSARLASANGGAFGIEDEAGGHTCLHLSLPLAPVS